MNQSDVCVVCGSDVDLDTEMTITIDGEKILVKICKTHADDITPKAAKAAYLERKLATDATMAAFLEQAAKLGMVVVPQGKMSTMVTQPVSQPVSQPVKPVVSSELQGGRNEGVLSSSEVDNILQNRVSGMSGSVDGTGVERHAAYNPNDLTDKLPDGARDGLVKMELTEGRQGTPMAIPAIRQDGLGTTRIKVTKSMSDADLQRRFKQLAAADHSFSQGYDLHRCPMCKGDGQISKSQTEVIVCPKCGGSGIT